MTSPERYFFDIPVYRLSEDQYYRELSRHVENALFPASDPTSAAMRERDIAHPQENISMRAHLARKYGGCWLYNEIIGYIRLFFLGSQVRGEYFCISQKRLARTRHKVFEQKSLKLVPERDIPDITSNSTIFNAVLQYLADCRTELRRRHVDSSLLEEVGPYIDWRSLLSHD